eukprot:gene3957-726_t
MDPRWGTLSSSCHPGVPDPTAAATGPVCAAVADLPGSVALVVACMCRGRCVHGGHRGAPRYTHTTLHAPALPTTDLLTFHPRPGGPVRAPRSTRRCLRASEVMAEAKAIAQPLDLVRNCIDQRILVKLRGNRVLRGVLHGYDQHLNLVLGNAQEVVTTTAVDTKTYEERTEKETRDIPMLFVRGDGIILIAPPADAGAGHNAHNAAQPMGLHPGLGLAAPHTAANPYPDFGSLAAVATRVRTDLSPAWNGPSGSGSTRPRTDRYPQSNSVQATPAFQLAYDGLCNLMAAGTWHADTETFAETPEALTRAYTQ